jgi:hypothetical protein
VNVGFLRVGRAAVAAVACAAAVTACAGPADDVQPRQPIPTFSAPPSPGLAGQVRPRVTLLPTDCAEVVPAPTMSALLGQPMDSMQVHTVLGMAAPSVGRLERVACQYQRAGVKGVAPLELNLAAYATSAASDAQLVTNSGAEKVDALSSEDVSIGSAHAVLFRERGKSVLLVSSGRSTITMTLQDGVIASEQTRPVMVDLVQRVLPSLAPGPSGASR